MRVLSGFVDLTCSLIVTVGVLSVMSCPGSVALKWPGTSVGCRMRGTVDVSKDSSKKKEARLMAFVACFF